MIAPLLTIFLSLLAATPAAAADPRKCIGANGKPMYVDGPCPAGSKPAEMRPPATGQGGSHQSPETTPGPQVPGVTTSYYDVTGADRGLIRTQMHRLGPDGFFAHSKWQVHYQYRGVPRDGQCLLTQPQVSFKGEISMPRWVQRAGAGAELVAHWNRFEAALLVHEQGHIANGRDFERELTAALNSFPPAPDCGALDRAIRSLYDSLHGKYMSRDKEYDQRTGHGKTQGATF